MKINDIDTLTENENGYPPVSMSNIENKFSHNGINYDNKDGMGAVPFNNNVLYMGFAAVMTASDFLSLARSADRSESAEQFAYAMGKEEQPIGCPFLKFYVQENDDGIVQSIEIDGHEGRGRAEAVKLLNKGYGSDEGNPVLDNEEIVVHFLGASGIRSRHLDKKFFNAIKFKGIISQNGDIVKPSLREIFHDPNHR